jgi:hypothetical protein
MHVRVPTAPAEKLVGAGVATSFPVPTSGPWGRRIAPPARRRAPEDLITVMTEWGRGAEIIES